MNNTVRFNSLVDASSLIGALTTQNTSLSTLLSSLDPKGIPSTFDFQTLSSTLAIANGKLAQAVRGLAAQPKNPEKGYQSPFMLSLAGTIKSAAESLIQLGDQLAEKSLDGIAQKVFDSSLEIGALLEESSVVAPTPPPPTRKRQSKLRTELPGTIKSTKVAKVIAKFDLSNKGDDFGLHDSLLAKMFAAIFHTYSTSTFSRKMARELIEGIDQFRNLRGVPANLWSCLTNSSLIRESAESRATLHIFEFTDKAYQAFMKGMEES